jgi:hypothetical protein
MFPDNMHDKENQRDSAQVPQTLWIESDTAEPKPLLYGQRIGGDKQVEPLPQRSEPKWTQFAAQDGAGNGVIAGDGGGA